MSRQEILVQFEQCGILPTPQRVEVAQILLRKPQHLSAEQIIERLEAAGSTVSKATVYNSLNLLTEYGLVNECLVDPHRVFYDSTTSAHHHFYNADTGELTDISSASVKISGLPVLPAGTQLEGAELIVRIRNSSR